MLLNDVDAGLGSFVPELGPLEPVQQARWAGSPTTSVFKVLEMALGAEQVDLPAQSDVRHYRYLQYHQQRVTFFLQLDREADLRGCDSGPLHQNVAKMSPSRWGRASRVGSFRRLGRGHALRRYRGWLLQAGQRGN